MSQQRIKANISTSIVALAILTSPSLAETAKTEGRETAELTFASIDRNSQGFIHQGDLEAFRSDVFASMDGDDNGRLTYPEFSAWDPGFSEIAAKENKSDAFVTATKIIFSIWDRNADDQITVSEMRFAMTADFRRADVNDDAVLSQDEFLKNFAIIVAMRAAVRPDL
ncbi:MAG: hypothetical protein ABJO09_02235 [Hyphomicrobiales bacterium]